MPELRPAQPGEHTDRHGDHWRRVAHGSWVRVEEPHVERTAVDAQRDYGPFTPPLGDRHCPTCRCGVVDSNDR